jgi:hypothetical protein
MLPSCLRGRTTSAHESSRASPLSAPHTPVPRCEPFLLCDSTPCSECEQFGYRGNECGGRLAIMPECKAGGGASCLSARWRGSQALPSHYACPLLPSGPRGCIHDNNRATRRCTSGRHTQHSFPECTYTCSNAGKALHSLGRVPLRRFDIRKLRAGQQHMKEQHLSGSTCVDCGQAIKLVS